MSKPNDIDMLLFDVRNNFYLGAYQNCINEAQNVHLKTDEGKLLRDVYMYRAYIAQNKPSIVVNEIDVHSSQPSLTAVRRFADYMANPSKRAQILAELEKEMSGELPNDDVLFLMNAFIYMHERNLDSALRLLHQSDSLECMAATVECLLSMDRVDLAAKEVKKMQEMDEDATITQLALAWINTAIGKEKLKDAFYIYQEMIDKYGATPLLLVAQASCLIQQQKYDEAEKLLLEAQQRDANYAEALIDLVVVSQYLGKAPEVTNRYVNQLKEGHPSHPWTLDYIAAEKQFDRVMLETTI